MQEKLKPLIARVFELRKQFYEIDTKLEQQLGGPASESEINGFEKEIGFKLPPSYRAFLLLHDGWTSWEGDISILSVAQMREGQYAQWIQEWKKEAAEDGETLVQKGIVIATQIQSDTGLILDTEHADENGEMPIVNWDRNEIARYNDFVDLLERTAEVLEGLIKK